MHLVLFCAKASKNQAHRENCSFQPEPSDIVFDSAHNGFYIVSDNGFLFKTDVSGNVLQQADYEGQDNEAVYADEEFVYAVEERSHKIVVFQKSDLSHVATYLIPYFGGRNKGYEAFTFNPEKIDELSSRKRPDLFI